MEHVRLIEACALLPMLHTPADRKNVVACFGSHAELFAADVLRWPDVSQVFLSEAPTKLTDKRIIVTVPPVASCHVVICSPNEDPSKHLHAIAPSGIINVCTARMDYAKGLFVAMRHLFRSITPWREWLPEPLYGAMASPGGAKVTRQRHPPPGARRLSSQYLPSLFTFGKDELPYVLPQALPHAKPPQPAPERAAEAPEPTKFPD